MPELLLMRHGKSDWDEGLHDLDRKLTDRGKRDAQRVGDWLRREERVPDTVIASPARRARDTAEECMRASGIAISALTTDPLIYQATGETLINIARKAGSGRTLIVGHNPGIEEAVMSLSSEPLQLTMSGKLMTTAAMAQFSVDAGVTTLRALIRPDELPRRFEYPAQTGTEYRKRPAYYYFQAGAIPYRVRDGQIEFLLVTTNKGKWSIPRGIIEPGLTAQESARKEAMVEAGVAGDVEDRLLASLTVQKWGADCSLEVYAMNVTSLLYEGRWQRKRRERRWFSLDRAQRSINLPELTTVLSQVAGEKQQLASQAG